jgi:hypothetical protein
MNIHITHKSKIHSAKLSSLNSRFQRLKLQPHAIPPRFRLQLSLSPNLLAIRFVYTKFDGIRHKASLWNRYNVSGLLVRTYVSETGDLLCLLNCRMDGIWTLYTDLNGKLVGVEKVEAVLRVMGEVSVEWEEPGRGLIMSKAAWAILKG